MANRKFTFNVASDPKYTFGFTGFKLNGASPLKEEVEEPDEFETWVRDTRKANGIIDPEPEPKPVPEDRIAGQILWSGTLTMPNTKFHGIITNITGSSDDKPAGSDHEGD